MIMRNTSSDEQSQNTKPTGEVEALPVQSPNQSQIDELKKLTAKNNAALAAFGYPTTPLPPDLPAAPLADTNHEPVTDDILRRSNS